MGLNMQERHATVRELAPQFQKASKQERGRILDQFTALTGYTRTYAAFVLRTCGKRQIKILDGGKRRVVFIVGHCRKTGAKRRRRRQYEGKAFLTALRQLWALSDGLCGKRLVAFIREVLPLLESQGALTLSDTDLRAHLLRVSPATADRLLAKTKAQARLKGRSATRPGTLLKHHIPVRTFADWNEAQPGFCEVDLVAHDGGAAFGEYCQTLALTDVATAWVEMEALKNKAQVHVFQAIQDVRVHLPFALQGLDSDNGGEFINDQLYRYCLDEKITFTRSRAYHKNDNCFVEQKNYSIIRRTVGYYRYDTSEQLALLRDFYQTLRLYTNFFQPVMKLVEKIRSGSRIIRRYDVPRTPYLRILEHPTISDDLKARLQAQYRQLNVVQLKRQLDQIQTQLFHSAVTAGPPLRSTLPGYPIADHPWRRSLIGTKYNERGKQRATNPDLLHDQTKNGCIKTMKSPNSPPEPSLPNSP